MSKTVLLLLAVFVAMPSPALPSQGRIGEVVQKSLPLLERLAAEKSVIQDILVRNATPLPPTEVQKIQREWTEIGISDLERPYLHNGSSEEMRRYEPWIPVMLKCFVLDCRGNVVGTAPQCNDFVHGTMDKFLKCYNRGRGRVYLSPAGLDVSTKIYSIQVSVPVFCEGRTIGVLVATLSLE